MTLSLLPKKITHLQKICLAGLFIAITTLLQKVVAINNLAIIPFLRISLGGPAVIIFSSIFLGPIYGALIGAASDVIGYFFFDRSSFGFFPQITAIYFILGLISYFIFALVKLIKNQKVLLISEGIFLFILFFLVSLIIIFNNDLTLYSSTYHIELWQKIVIPIILFILMSLLFVITILINKKYGQDKIALSPLTISGACFLIEILVMVIFGSLMKGFAFGFNTYPVILLTQIIVLFINVPLNTLFIILFLRITHRFY